MQALKNGISAIFLSSVLFACGSGGGGGGDSSSGGGFIDPATCVLPGNVVAITDANAVAVVSEVISAIQTVLAFANADSAFIELNDVMLLSNPATVPCDMGGNATVTLTDNDMSSDVSMGDLISSNFSSCMDTGATINGLFSATYTTVTEAVAGDAGNAASMNNWLFNITGNSNNLRVNDSNTNVAADGDSTADVSFNAAGALLTSTATNTILTFADSSGQCASVQSAAITSVVNNPVNVPATYTVNVNPAGALIVASTELAGVVMAQTPATPFGGMEALDNDSDGAVDDYFAELDQPASGVLVITGFMSSATVRVIAANMVEIDVDNNGDNIVDNTIPTTWDAL